MAAHNLKGLRPSWRMRRLPLREGRYGERFLICFFLGLVAGTVVANMIYPSLNSEAGYYVGVLKRGAGLGRQEQARLFPIICRQRLIEVAAAWFVSLTAYSILCFCVLSAGLGFSIAVVLTVMTGQMGIAGLPYFLVTVTPQALFYIPAWCLLLLWGTQRNGRLKVSGVLFLLGLTVAGSAAETWLNPFFMRFFL